MPWIKEDPKQIETQARDEVRLGLAAAYRDYAAQAESPFEREVWLKAAQLAESFVSR